MAKTKRNAAHDARSRAVAKTRAKAAKAPAKPARGTVYQLKITLDDIRPPIWRRVQTKDCTLATLHEIIQIVMGWEDYHLHEFEIDHQRFGAPEQWQEDFEESEMGNERKVKLSQLVKQGVKKLGYQYDMGDSWWHTIQIEKPLAPEPGAKYPRCLGGERACPPEDCGGPWGYGDFVDAIQNPQHPRHDELLEWIGGEFDPEAFDLETVNKELEEVA
jgi:hypothetical protein